VVFTSGTTDAINLVAHGYGRKFIGAGTRIVLTTRRAPTPTSCRGRWCGREGREDSRRPVNDAVNLVQDEYLKLLGPATKIVAVGPRLQRARHPSTR